MDSSLANKIELEHPVEESSTENKQLPSSTSNVDTTQNMQSTWNAPPAYTHANTSNTNSAQNNYNPMMAGNSTNAGFVNNQNLQGYPPNASGQFVYAGYPTPPQQYAVVSTQPVVASHWRQAGDFIERPATDYTAWSVINTFCCCFIFGVVAWVYSCQTSSANSMGRYTEAKQKTKISLGFNIAATITGVVAIMALVVLKVSVSNYY